MKIGGAREKNSLVKPQENFKPDEKSRHQGFWPCLKLPRSK
jgi:hypothetical protein